MGNCNGHDVIPLANQVGGPEPEVSGPSPSRWLLYHTSFLELLRMPREIPLNSPLLWAGGCWPTTCTQWEVLPDILYCRGEEGDNLPSLMLHKGRFFSKRFVARSEVSRTPRSVWPGHWIIQVWIQIQVIRFFPSRLWAVMDCQPL